MILDVCCGSLLMYHNMHKPIGDDFIYMDLRIADEHYYHGYTTPRYRIRAIRPLIRADLRYLPFRDDLFRLIVMDPPHDDFGAGDSLFMRKYGAWSTDDIVSHGKRANQEFRRVLKPHGFLILKIFRKRFGLYETLFNNFTFFLPIHRVSQSNLSKERISWFLGHLKESEQLQ